MKKGELKKKRMQKKAIQTVAIIGGVLVLLAAILIGIAMNNEDLYDHDHDHDHAGAAHTLRLATTAKPGEAHYAALEQFAKEVKSRTDGKVVVAIYDSGKLGNDKSLIGSMEKSEDVVDIVVSEMSNYKILDERMDISELPFLFDSYEAAWKFMDGSIQAQIENSLIDKKVRVLTHYTNGFDHITTAQKAVTKVDDLNGLALGTMENNYGVQAMRALNAGATLLEKNTLIQAIQGGTCKGYFGNLETIYDNELYYNQTYLIMTYHRYEGLAMSISEDTWKKLTQEQQEIIKTAATNSSYTDRNQIRQEEQEMIKNMQSAGIRVMYPKLEEFAEKTKAVIRGYSDVYGSLAEQILLEKE